MANKRILSLSHWGAFYAETDGKRIVGVSPFEKDPAPSRLIDSIPAMVHSPLRVAAPMVREGFLRRREGSDRTARGHDRFVPVSWDTALGLVADELSRVTAAHGRSAVFGGSYGWASAGRFHHARSQMRRFLFKTGGCVDQLTNYSFGAALVILPHIVGTHDGVNNGNNSWDSIARHTKTFVAFGGLNPKNWSVTSGGPGQHVMEEWSRRAAEAGVKFVVVSPVREDAPPWLDADWIAPRPNTDTALMLGIAHTLVVENLHDRDFLDRYCVGFDRFRAYLLGETDGVVKTAEWASAIADVPASTIRDLARRMAAGRTMVAASWSLQRMDHGEQPYWAVVALAAMLGQIGLPGGGYGFGYGSTNGVGNPTLPLAAPELDTGRNPLRLAIPVARIADMLLEPGSTIDFNGGRVTYPDVRMVFWAGGNPFHHHQDLNRFVRAWQKPETIVVNEIWWTPAARRADIVLPATTSFERNDIGGTSRDRFLFAMPRVIPPVGLARNDHDMLAEIADRIGGRAAFTDGRTEAEWMRYLYERLRAAAQAQGVGVPDFAEFWEQGWWEAPQPTEEVVMHGAFRRDPVQNRLQTPSGRIEIFSDKIASFAYDDCPPHPSWIEPAEWLGGATAKRWKLHMISSQPRDKLHSQLDGGPVSRGGKVAGREPLWINPSDAALRGVVDGAVVRVFNDRGACLAGAVVTDAVRPGVVILQTGSWFDPVEPADGVLERHGNPNVLTLDKGTSRLAQASSAMTALVEVAAFAEKVPAVEAFDLPEIAVA